MEILKKIGFGIILWVLIFFEVSISMFGFKIQYPSPGYILIHFIDNLHYFTEFNLF